MLLDAFNRHQTAPATTCVTNGEAGFLNAGPKKGQKVPAGTPCTGWYRGKKSTNGMCQRTGYDWDIFPITHYGWCGVEAAPGTTGTYSKADAAWGACARTCRPGDLSSPTQREPTQLHDSSRTFFAVVVFSCIFQHTHGSRLQKNSELSMPVFASLVTVRIYCSVVRQTSGGVRKE